MHAQVKGWSILSRLSHLASIGKKWHDAEKYSMMALRKLDGLSGCQGNGWREKRNGMVGGFHTSLVRSRF